MLLLGLTGDIASGKSTVAQLLRARGAVHLDADELVHELYRDRNFACRLQEHLQRFSTNRVLDIADKNGAINRRALGNLVFGDEPLLRHLESFVHPAVATLRAQKLATLRASASPPEVVVLEAVKLVESGQAADCDALWWISAARETQLRRLTQERQMNENDALERLKNQPPRAAKIAMLKKLGVSWQFVSNDGTREELAARVGLAWREMRTANLR